MPMLVSQDGETLFSNTPSLPSENAEIEQTLQLKKTLRMIQLSNEFIGELEALSINDNISLKYVLSIKNKYIDGSEREKQFTGWNKYTMYIYVNILSADNMDDLHIVLNDVKEGSGAYGYGYGYAYGYVWMYIDIYEYVWIYLDVYGYVWVCIQL